MMYSLPRMVVEAMTKPQRDSTSRRKALEMT
jgi:hypothetical protein